MQLTELDWKIAADARAAPPSARVPGTLPPADAATAGQRTRVLLIPGLHGSGPAHWQSWLQSRYVGALRVEQRDWRRPDLPSWAGQIHRTISSAAPANWVAVAHSFGCLALAHLLRQGHGSISSVLLVAPADPDKFGVTQLLPMRPLNVHAVVMASRSDPWMGPERAAAWALLWGARYVDCGDAGHINVASGFGPFPAAKREVDRMLTRATRTLSAGAAARSAVSFTDRTQPAARRHTRCFPST